ncbi:45683_t:CDS:2 [Gigaspora margarita]|uniref:45683_t:CDS:1 n=1 Tax=Gigaspora margarita TaxID=4874 RepID=A0ABN7UU88_GIGMA|nr:45683_t:CDS:2 [Gigaspora margarita]
MNKWYINLVTKNPNTKKAYQRSNNNNQLLLALLDSYICLREKDQNNLFT